MLEKLKTKGIQLSDNNGKLKVVTQRPLTEDQVEYLKQHKAELLSELRAENRGDPVTRLRALAGKYRIDPDELVSWYSQDQSDIQNMDDLTLDALVRDYACNRPTFRNEQPYEVYQLWLYRLDKNKSGYTRQGLMTNDSQEALRRLEAIYGSGCVFDLRREYRQ